ncbi:MAG TPA: hypothetical protein DCR93_21935, partial [Cytophagales bacterium]|nr:hypothetical protein [Cytophagales bacterium]
MKYFLLCLGLIATGWAHAQDSQWFCDETQEGFATRWFDTDLGKQKAVMVYPEGATPSRLIVFIHGDSPFGDPVYQYYISRNIAKMTNAIAVAILRPGYRDGCGDWSEGDKGLMMGDNYTQEVVHSLASVITTIKEEEGISETVIMGHSGGAALTALLAESNPELAD